MRERSDNTARLDVLLIPRRGAGRQNERCPRRGPGQGAMTIKSLEPGRTLLLQIIRF